jgi:hypothetical protein
MNTFCGGKNDDSNVISLMVFLKQGGSSVRNLLLG